MSYILGFWFADGSITRTHNGTLSEFRISQHISRLYLLEKINECLSSEYPIGDHTLTQKMLKAYSKTICEDIVKLGGKENKSLDVQFPQIPIEFSGSFIRGLWDGDGTISFNSNKRVNAWKATYTCGSEPFIYGLQDLIREINSRINGPIRFDPNRRSGVFRMHMSKYDTVRLACIMYATPSELFLEHKWENFMEACQLCQRENV